MKRLITFKDIKENKRKIAFTGIFAAAVVLLSVLIAVLNICYTANISDKQYSLDNMLSHVLSVSEEEHSVYDEEASEKVRSYISSTLFSYGVENEIITHNDVVLHNEKTDEFSYYKPKNIYAEIAGESKEKVLLVAHYDSCGYKIKYDEASEGSHGALDDGYGVAAVLELARIFSSQKNLKNGIKLAIVDAEEEGVLGSEALVKEYSQWLDDVNLVINVEGRGNKGPLYLFQTSGNNSRIIELYKKAGFPFSFSVAADVYGMLPNDTDLSPFLEKGLAGMNFAVLESLKVYHNEKDVYEAVDANSLAGYCDTLLPLLDEYTSNAKYASHDYFLNGHDTLFFTLFPNALVSYSAVTGWIFFGIIIALVCALIVVSILKKRLNWKKLLISLGIDLAFIVVTCGFGFIVALIASACAGVNYHVMFVIGVAFDGGLLIIFSLIMAAAFVFATLFKLKFGFTHSEMTLGGLSINTLLAIVCAAVIFGGTYLFVIPVLLYAIGEGVNLFVKNEKIRLGVCAAACAVATIFTLSIYISLLYSLYVSLTFGALGIIAAFAILPLTMCVPQICGLFCGVPEKAQVKEAV
ncbi:MAG: M28 family peptidase [Clostridia bacterium]|nr:M28 family peptidase [Clostridia bacterium]